MKKHLATLFALVVLASCSKEEKKGNLQITGNVKGLKKGTLYLKKLVDTALVDIDSIAIDGDSKFATATDIAEPEVLYLFLDRGKTASIDNSLPFFAEPGKMTIDTDLETFYAKAKITGSKNQKLWEEYKSVKAKFVTQEVEIQAKDLQAQIKNETLPATEVAKYESALKRRFLYTANFAVVNKDFEVAPYVILTETPNLGLNYLKTVVESMSPKVANSKYGKLLLEHYDARKKEETPVALK